jgi:hypothetical protein
MSLADSQPPNTKKAKAGTVNTFMRFLGEEGVKLEAVGNAVRGDMLGQVLVALMDRFGLYLSLYKTSAGNALARHSVMQYFRQAKMWLLDRYPRLTPLVDKTLLTLPQKPNMSLCSENIFFVRFVRVKTSDEHTCPSRALSQRSQ